MSSFVQCFNRGENIVQPFIGEGNNQHGAPVAGNSPGQDFDHEDYSFRLVPTSACGSGPLQVGKAMRMFINNGLEMVQDFETETGGSPEVLLRELVQGQTFTNTQLANRLAYELNRLFTWKDDANIAKYQHGFVLCLEAALCLADERK